jgi:HNH endonuclease
VAKRRASLRERVWSRAGGCCEYCQLPQVYDSLPFHVEHIISKKHRGPTVFANLALSCPGCNLGKASNIAGRDVQTGELTRLFHPRTDIWAEHFTWDGPLLVGTTAIGRTTVEVPVINEPERVRLRNLLIGLGVFPPER